MPSDQFDERQRRDWLRLMKSEHVGPVTFRRLIARYGEAAAALAALPELSRRGGLVRPIRLYPIKAAEADLEAAGDLGARFIALNEADHPQLLRQTNSAAPRRSSASRATRRCCRTPWLPWSAPATPRRPDGAWRVTSHRPWVTPA